MKEGVVKKIKRSFNFPSQWDLGVQGVISDWGNLLDSQQIIWIWLHAVTFLS